MKNIYKSNEQGVCPKCYCKNLDYNKTEISEELSYAYECPDCKFKGIEWYGISFSSHTDQKGEAVI